MHCFHYSKIGMCGYIYRLTVGHPNTKPETRNEESKVNVKLSKIRTCILFRQHVQKEATFQAKYLKITEYASVHSSALNIGFNSPSFQHLLNGYRTTSNHKVSEYRIVIHFCESICSFYRRRTSAVVGNFNNP